jgi:hypothetical protein
MQKASTMPRVQHNLAYGGRHHDIFRDGLVQRSLVLRGTAAIRRIGSEDIETDRLTVHVPGDIAASGNTAYAVTGSQVYNALQSYLPLGTGGTYFAETSADDRYVRTIRTTSGTFVGLSPQLKLEDLHNVNELAGQNNTLPPNTPGFLVWAGAISGLPDEFVQWDMFSTYPHSFTGHGSPQVGDVLMYRGGYTNPGEQSQNYHWAQPNFNFQSDFTVTKPSTGQYNIAFGTQSLPQYTYIILLTAETNDYSIVYLSKAQAGFSVYTKSACRFDFCCISQGRIFCHGSVSSAGVADAETSY